MSGDFRNDSLLRTILVVFFGVLAFGLLFNLFTGGGTTMGEHMGNMGYASGYGFSLGGLIVGLLALLVKILMVVLVAAVVIGAFAWVKNNFLQNNNSQWMQSINKDPVLKTISVVTLAIIGIVFLCALFSSFGQTGIGFGGYLGGYGFNPIYSMAGILVLLVRVLMFVLIVSLILAVVTYLKKQYDSGNLNFFGAGKNQGANTTAENQENQQPYDNIKDRVKEKDFESKI
ncbi:MAG: hypothetical protein K0R31_601 [Clostridiales bacterium]|nr:hypothetical protein [Clostridiales bacterium]